jgi:hypothetical protein
MRAIELRLRAHEHVDYDHLGHWSGSLRLTARAWRAW